MLRDVLDGRVHLNYALRTFVRKTQRCHRSILIGVIDDHALKNIGALCVQVYRETRADFDFAGSAQPCRLSIQPLDLLTLYP